MVEVNLRPLIWRQVAEVFIIGIMWQEGNSIAANAVKDQLREGRFS